MRWRDEAGRAARTRDDIVIVEERKDGFLVSTDPTRLDVGVIHGYLARSYWAAGIPVPLVERAIAGSLCFGVYEEGHARDTEAPRARQVGFARVITDRATFAYLADVFVLESYQGRGLGTWLVQVIVAHPDLQGLRRFALATRDAHGLYSRFGFAPLLAPDRHMEIVRRDPYRQTGGPA